MLFRSVSLVLHSATKAIGGHNDATLGVIAGERDLVDAVWGYATLHGSVASPFDSWNALRGIRTLGVRIERMSSTALAIARFLESHPAVMSVSYPGLESHPQRAIIERQMSSGGSMLSFELRDADFAHRVLRSLELIRVATSLGGPDTLMCHPASTTHAGLSDDLQAAIGVTPGLMRISVGLEHPDDLLADLGRAIGRS